MINKKELENNAKELANSFRRFCKDVESNPAASAFGDLKDFAKEAGYDDNEALICIAYLMIQGLYRVN